MLTTKKAFISSSVLFSIGASALLATPAHANVVQPDLAKANLKVASANGIQIKAKTTQKIAKTTANLNLRKGIGTKHGVIKVLNKGTTVTILKTSNGWSQVKASGKTGWVSSKYLTKSKTVVTSSSNKKPVKVTATNKQSTKYTTANLNMRKGASTKHGVVKVLAKNTKVSVIRTSNGWSQVKASGKTGWVSSKYLTHSIKSNNSMNIAPTGNISDSSTRSSIVKHAKANLGVKYRFGGTSPVTGWDCSGYMQYVFDKAGVDIPRTKAWRGLKEVSQKNAKPGDMVMQYGGGHVGIYAGNGTQYHAGNPSTGTVHSKIWDSNAKFYSVNSII